MPATIAATNDNNFGAFKEARRAEQAGKPLPNVPVKAEAEASAPPPAPTSPEVGEKTAEPTPEARELSKRQQKQNDAIREAVDRATADLRAENERLKAAQKPASEPAKPPTPDQPEYKRIVAMPNAPKLADFDSVEEHAAAMALFVDDQREQARAAKEATERATSEVTKTIETFQGQITQAGGKAFLDKLIPEVQQLQPVEALHARGAGDQVGPLNVLTSAIVKSARAPQLLQYFSDHPDALDTVKACATVGDVYRALGTVEAKLDAPSPAAPAPKTITSASQPVTTLSTARSAAPADAEHAAIEQNDFRAFKAIQLEKRRAAQRA